MGPTATLFRKKIKNGSHGTIHIFKNYFATVFSVSPKISSIQMDPICAPLAALFDRRYRFFFSFSFFFFFQRVLKPLFVDKLFTDLLLRTYNSFSSTNTIPQM